MMIPGQVTMIPLLLLFEKLGMVGTPLPLVIHAFFGVPFYIFLLRQFFMGLPDSLREAAKIDGAGEFRIYCRDAISSGIIGNLTSVTASLYQDWKHLTTGTWRQIPSLSGGGMLMDSGSHIIDVLLWTTGLKPIEVESKMEQHHTPVEQDSFNSIRFENNVIAGLNIVGNAPCWHETYVFCGENGAIFYDNGKIVLHLNGKEPVIPELPQQTTNSDKSFIDAILGHHNVMVPGDFAKEVVKLTERIYQSAGYKTITSIK